MQECKNARTKECRKKNNSVTHLPCYPVTLLPCYPVTIMDEISEKLIDIEAVIASKNPALLRWIPKFVISYLKRITHQDEVNGYIWRNRHLSGVPFVIAILKEFGVKVEVNCLRNNDLTPQPPLLEGEGEHLASCISHLSSGRYIIAANHPLGGIDGMALMQEVGRVRPDIVFPVNDLLMNVPGLRPLFIPINKHGKNTENARIIDATFASEKLVLFFPAGLVSRKMDRRMQKKNHPSSRFRDPSHQSRVTSHEIRDLEWKSTFIKKSKKYHRDVVPVFIGGRNSEWFYNLSRWRMRLGIKANIEMLYLVDEMAKQFGKTITLTFGDPIPYTTFDKSKTEAQWAEWVKEQVYGLAHSPD
jgi:putative hemolysin